MPLSTEDLGGPWSRKPPNWRLRGFLVVAALAGLAFLAASFWKGQHQQVYVVNGTAAPYSVELNGVGSNLPPSSCTPVRLAQGEVNVRVIGAPLDVPDQLVRISDSFWTRLLKPRTFVLNPDRAAVLQWQEVEFAVNPSGSNDRSQLHAGQVLHSFDGIDYAFEEYPASVDLKRGKPVLKQRISQVVNWPLEQIFMALAAQQQEQATQEFLLGNARFGSTDEVVWNAIIAMIEHEKLVNFLKPGL